LRTAAEPDGDVDIARSAPPTVVTSPSRRVERDGPSRPPGTFRDEYCAETTTAVAELTAGHEASADRATLERGNAIVKPTGIFHQERARANSRAGNTRRRDGR
jgi:hypothetical protein